MAYDDKDCENGLCPVNGVKKEGEEGDSSKDVFYCLQSTTTEEIKQAQSKSAKLLKDVESSQGILGETQESIKATLEVMNGSLGRIFTLWEKQEERLDRGDKLFQEIKEFMVDKKRANGYTEDGLKEVKEDIKDLKGDIGDIKTDIAKLGMSISDNREEDKEKKKEDKEAKKRKLDIRDKIVIGLILIIASAVLSQFIIFLIKTFIWGY